MSFHAIVRKEIEKNKYLTGVQYNGELDQYEFFKEAMEQKVSEAKVKHILDGDFYEMPEPRFEIQQLEWNRQGIQMLDQEEIKDNNKVIKDFRKQQNAILADIQIIKGIAEAMTTTVVKRHFKEFEQRLDISPLARLKMTMEAMDRRYRMFNNSNTSGDGWDWILYNRPRCFVPDRTTESDQR
jgi:hypothetical protein